jgi:hypothetical protein
MFFSGNETPNFPLKLSQLGLKAARTLTYQIINQVMVPTKKSG